MKRPSLRIQILLFCVLALAATLVGNALHPSGLDLQRDYFPQSGGTGQMRAPDGGLPEHDFQTLTVEEMADYAGLLYDGNDVIYLDARSPAEYAYGHIPGAYLCHYYEKDEYLPGLLPKFEHAIIIAVYCQGGDCEDSLALCMDLVYEHGVDKSLVHLFEGGVDAWVAAGHPLKEGEER